MEAFPLSLVDCVCLGFCTMDWPFCLKLTQSQLLGRPFPSGTEPFGLKERFEGLCLCICSFLFSISDGSKSRHSQVLGGDARRGAGGVPVYLQQLLHARGAVPLLAAQAKQVLQEVACSLLCCSMDTIYVTSQVTAFSTWHSIVDICMAAIDNKAQECTHTTGTQQRDSIVTEEMRSWQARRDAGVDAAFPS